MQNFKRTINNFLCTSKKQKTLGFQNFLRYVYFLRYKIFYATLWASEYKSEAKVVEAEVKGVEADRFIKELLPYS